MVPVREVWSHYIAVSSMSPLHLPLRATIGNGAQLATTTEINIAITTALSALPSEVTNEDADNARQIRANANSHSQVIVGVEWGLRSYRIDQSTRWGKKKSLYIKND